MDFNASSPYCTEILTPYVQNLTSSYADKSNESSIVVTSIVMFLLAALFFILNLFSRFSDISAILNPSVRLFLTASLSLFLPVMSYLFSEAKNEGATANGSGQLKTELPLRARTILMWMLLVELLRKKVEAILVNVGVQWYSGTIDRASRIAWLGYLVFFNIRSTGKRAIYGTLWVLAAAKLVQRVAMNEILNRSFAYGKNARLLNSYMTQMLHGQDVQQEDVGSKLLKSCKYAVMGEDNLEKEAGPEGYHLELSKVAEDATAVVTVGEIWVLADKDQLLQRDHRLKRLCLSFALHKLLRRRFEDLPITGAEARNCRDLIFGGLCKEGTDREAVAVALFQVFNDEIQFLCEYYHSVLPVVLSNPFFFLANYILFPITVWAFCVLTVILCSNGDLLYAYGSIQSDNYTLSTGIMKMTGCFLRIILSSPSALFSTVDLAVTILLGLTFLYEQVWEFLVFILSNWLMVSLLRHYTAKPRWRQSPIFSGIISSILWVRNVMSHPNLCFKQFSVMKPLQGRVPLTLPTKAVAKEAKFSIMEYMEYLLGYRQIGGRAAEPLSNGWSALERHPEYHSELSWACQSESVAEVILTWHIATCLLEVKYPWQKGTTSGSPGRKVATSLSKYCAYLVAFYPELLPDDREGTERVYKNMKTGLMEAGTLGCWGYYFSPEGTWCEKVLAVEARPVEEHQELAAMPVVWKGARLGKILLDKATSGNEKQVWKVLADLWTELIVYTAPSSGEVHVKAHKEALAQGGEFITVLWALATHTGVARPAVKPWAVIPVQHVEGTASVPSACV